MNKYERRLNEFRSISETLTIKQHEINDEFEIDIDIEIIFFVILWATLILFRQVEFIISNVDCLFH